jgi:hypothetical protein
MAQNKVINDDNIMSAMECVDKNFSEIESSDSDNEIDDNQEEIIITKVAYQIVNKATGKGLQ